MKSRAKKLVDKTTNQSAHLFQPYLCMLLIGVLSILLWAWAKRGYATQISFAVLFITILLSWFTWRESKDRSDLGRSHAVITVALSGLWVVLAVLNKPWNPDVLLVWFLGGITLSLTWNIKLVMRSDNRDDAMAIFFKDIGLEGTRLYPTFKSKDKFKATVSLKRGYGTVEALQRAKSRIASLFGAPPNGVRIIPDPDNEAKASLTVVLRDMLKDPVDYSWEYKESTPNDPFTIGVYEDSEPVKFSLHSPDLGAAHMLIQGMNGSGKSEAAKVMFAEACKIKELEIWIIDTKKGSQTLGFISDKADWVIGEERIADLLFKKFSLIIKARADFLGKKGLEKWEPGCGLSFIYLHIEEASGLISDNPAFIGMMETARSTGIQITASLQRASYVSIDTASRAQFSAVLCFGVSDIADANFALPDEVIDAGANPAIWRNSKPGYAYLVHPTINSEQWTTPLRTFKMNRTSLETAFAERLPNDLDPVTLGALGDLYQAQVDNDPTNDVEENEIFFTEEEQKEVEELQAKFDVQLDFGDPMEPLSPEDAREVFNEKIKQLQDDGITEFSAPEMGDVIVATGRSRAWLRDRLLELVEQGVLEKEFATYKFVPKLK